MNLGKSVYNLLKRQSEVYVSGLGTFKRNHTPSTYDEKRNVYLPPIDYIDFDRTSETGYDFINYIQQLHLMERTDAQQQVEAIVGDLLQKVKDEGQAKLDDLGYLVSYGEGYVFKALDLSGFNYDPVEALVAPVSLEEDPVEAVIQEEAPEMTAEDAVQIPIIPEEQLAPEVEVGEVFVEEEFVEKSSSNTIWYVLIAIVALGILAALYFRNKDGAAIRKPAGTASVQKQADTLQDVGSGDSTASTLLADTVITGDSAARSAQEVLLPANHNWQIVIGSHKTLAQAYEQAESYNKAGYPRVRVVPSNLAKNRKKVIWDSYETKEQVDSALYYVQKHVIKDAWPDKINSK